MNIPVDDNAGLDLGQFLDQDLGRYEEDAEMVEGMELEGEGEDEDKDEGERLNWDDEAEGDRLAEEEIEVQEHLLNAREAMREMEAMLVDAMGEPNEDERFELPGEEGPEPEVLGEDEGMDEDEEDDGEEDQ